MEIKLIVSADEKFLSVLEKLTGLLNITPQNLEVTEISDVKALERNNEDYGMFNEMKDLAVDLKEKNQTLYLEVLHKYVTDGKKYSAIEPKDWGNAIKDFKKALMSKTDPKENSKNYSIEELRATATTIVKAGHKEALQEVFQSVGVSKLSDIQAEDSAKVMELLETLIEEKGLK